MTSINALAVKAVPYLLGIIIALAGFIWSDVKATLGTVQLMQFQQIKDGAEISRMAEQLRDHEVRLRAKGINDERGAYRIKALP
jgi:hypothetical protein